MLIPKKQQKQIHFFKHARVLVIVLFPDIINLINKLLVDYWDVFQSKECEHKPVYG